MQLLLHCNAALGALLTQALSVLPLGRPFDCTACVRWSLSGPGLEQHGGSRKVGIPSLYRPSLPQLHCLASARRGEADEARTVLVQSEEEEES